MALEPSEVQAREKARRKRERIIIAITCVAMVAVTWFESQVLGLSETLPLGSSILVFALININVLLLLTLIFLVARNLVKLMVERKRGVLGSRLRTKLVAAFVSLSLAPTVILFFAAFQFVSTSMDYWFSARLERGLFDAVESSAAHNQQTLAWLSHFGGNLAGELEAPGHNLSEPNKDLTKLIEAKRKLYDLAAVRVFSPNLKELAYATQSGTHLNHLRGFPMDLVSQAMAEGKPQSHLQAAPTGDFAAAVHPLGKGKSAAAVAVFKLLPNQTMARTQSIKKGLFDYRELMALKGPIKTNQYMTLSIVGLLVIFTATWFGFHLAKTMTVPLMELADGTKRIAEGDYNFYIDMEGNDEIGTLVNAFNRMTADLTTSKARLDEAHQEMRRTNLELDQRRRYMEIVLANVAAGVITVDAVGRITTFNASAERMLKSKAATVLGRHWRDLLPLDHQAMVRGLVNHLSQSGRGTVERQVRVNLAGETMTLMLNLGLLRDEAGHDLGWVVVFEDLTELEKAQRMAAWREVARRIAHEVKNPLTPIKLSAQRLVRRYRDKLPDDPKVFDECTNAIVTQVEELKRLVNEFSTFARLPAVRLARADLAAIAEETLTMYRGAHAEVEFALELESEIPPFDLDREQMSRVLINLLDNAVAALSDNTASRQVVVRLSHDDILKITRIEVEDNGPGVPAEDKLHLFEPYFSTKKGGTGLGLAIVSTIVADHGGYVRVRDNAPKGTRIIIELPAKDPAGTWEA